MDRASMLSLSKSNVFRCVLSNNHSLSPLDVPNYGLQYLCNLKKWFLFVDTQTEIFLIRYTQTEIRLGSLSNHLMDRWDENPPQKS